MHIRIGSRYPALTRVVAAMTVAFASNGAAHSADHPAIAGGFSSPQTQSGDDAGSGRVPSGELGGGFPGPDPCSVKSDPTPEHCGFLERRIFHECPNVILTYPCPSGRTGIVDVGAFDLNPPDGIIDSTELQCAIDCLDGESLTEAWLPTMPGPPEGLQAGATLVMRPALTCHIAEQVFLPWHAGGPVTLRGNGARLVAQSLPVGDAILTRAPPLGADDCDVAEMARGASAWLIQDLVFVGLPPASSRLGLQVVGSQALTVRNCHFSGLAVGMELRAAQVPTVEGCQFNGCLTDGLRIVDGDYPPMNGLGSWAPGSCDGLSGTSTVAVRRCQFGVAGSGVGLRLRGVSNALVDQPDVLCAGGGATAILIEDSPRDTSVEKNSRQVIVRDAVSRGEPTQPGYTFIRNEGSGQCIVQGLQQWSSGLPRAILYDGDSPGSAGQRVEFDGLLTNLWIRFAGTDTTRFSFRDVQVRILPTDVWDMADLRHSNFWIGARPRHVHHEHFESPDTRADCLPEEPVVGDIAYFDGSATTCPPGLEPPPVGLYYWGPRTIGQVPEWIQIKEGP